MLTIRLFMLYWQMLSAHSIAPGTGTCMLKDYLVANPTTLLLKEEKGLL